MNNYKVNVGLYILLTAILVAFLYTKATMYENKEPKPFNYFELGYILGKENKTGSQAQWAADSASFYGNLYIY